MSRYFLAILLLAVVALAAAQEQKCSSNEEWNLCGKMCEPSCDDQEPDPRFCPHLQCTKEMASCRCEKGYFRKGKNECVVKEQC